MSKENLNDKNIDSRYDKIKWFSIGSVVLLIAIVIVGNFLFDIVLGNALTFDFSDYSQNTISQESVDYLNSLPQDARIRIVGLFNRPENVAGTSYQYIIPLLDDYAKKSGGRVTVDYINPTEQPTIISSLDPTSSYDLASNSGNFVVEYNGRVKIITPIDCYSYDNSYYMQYGVYLVNGNNTEYTFTNTMNYLTTGFTKKAYVVTGLKEETHVNLNRVLEGMAIEVVELPASDNFVVPDDCDLLILNGPNTDISEKMYVSLSDYLSKGGKIYVCVDFSSLNVNEKYDRLNRLLNEMNINIDPLLIYENDPGYQRSGYAVDSVVMADGKFYDYASLPYMHCTNGRSIRMIDNPKSTIETYPVLVTSDNSSTLELDSNGNPIEDGVQIIGQHNAAMYSYNPANSSKVFVFGTLNFSSDAFIDEYSLNDINIDFFRACVRELVGSDTLTMLNITTKTVDNYSLDSSKVTVSNAMVMLAVFMVLIPVVLVSVAVVVYVKRKNL